MWIIIIEVLKRIIFLSSSKSSIEVGQIPGKIVIYIYLPYDLLLFCIFLLAELFGHLRSSSIIFDHLRSSSIIFDHLRSSSILVQRRAFLCSYVQWAVFCTPALPRGYQRKQVTRWALARGVALSEVFSTTWFLPSKDGLGETVLVVYVASFLDIICGWGIE